MRDGGRGGSIILLSSIDSLYAAPGGEGIYGACKAAINNITPTMAVELGQHQIRVNAIAPAAVETPADRALAGDGGRPPGALRLLSAPPSGPAGGRRRCCRVLRLRRGRVGVGIDPAGVRRRGDDQRPISLSHARQPRAGVSCGRKSVVLRPCRSTLSIFCPGPTSTRRPTTLTRTRSSTLFVAARSTPSIWIRWRCARSTASTPSA